MNILYYCVEYHQAFGPSTHAREFFAELQKIPKVGSCKVIPVSPEKVKDVNRLSISSKDASFFRRAVRAVTPRWPVALVWFLFPKKEALVLIRGELMTGQWDALVMRPGRSLVLIPKLKNEFPQVRILLEINSAIFDESFKGIWFRPFWKKVEARLINSADWVTTVSKYLKTYLVQHGVDECKICVNPNGVNLSLFNSGRFSAESRNSMRALFGIPKDTMLFGYVGGMQSFRKLPQMVKYFAELLESHPLDATLLLIGDGIDMNQICEIHSSFSSVIQKRIIIAGPKPYSDIPQIMSIFDVAVFPFSNPYGSPQKLFEYMAMGLPVIGPKVPVVEETFRDGEHLFLVDQDDGSSFKRQFMHCVENPAALNIIAKSAEKYVSDEYTWRKNAERVFAFLAQNT